MSRLKRFLLIYAVVYTALAIFGLLLFRSPHLSAGYLERHGAAHQRYVSITTAPDFDRFWQRPHLFPPDEPRHAQLAFVLEYVARPEYRAERRRIEAFSVYFHLLNGVMFLVLVVRFGRRPVVDYLDNRVRETAARLTDSAAARTASMHKLAEAEADAGVWPRREKEMNKRTDGAIESSLARIREEARLARIQLERETEDRKRAELIRAAAQIKEEMVSEAIRQIEARYTAEATELDLRRNVEQFVRILDLIT